MNQPQTDSWDDAEKLLKKFQPARYSLHHRIIKDDHEFSWIGYDGIRYSPVFSDYNEALKYPSENAMIPQA